MGRRNRTLLLCCMVGAFWLWGAPLLAAGQPGAPQGKAPTPDGHFQVRTTTIDPDQGVSWEEAQLRYKGQGYPFVLQSQTNTTLDVLTNLTGEHINVDGLVFHLKNLPDFAGTYTRIAPEVARATWGSDSGAVFQNSQGVVVQVNKGPRSESLYRSLLGNSFQILLSDF